MAEAIVVEYGGKRMPVTPGTAEKDIKALMARFFPELADPKIDKKKDGDKKDAGPASPMSGPHAHFCGIHMAKLNPKLQFVTQHYCTAHTGDHGGGTGDAETQRFLEGGGARRGICRR